MTTDVSRTKARPLTLCNQASATGLGAIRSTRRSESMIQVTLISA